ncbi:MAG: hypothetical protein NTV44_00595 [Firmicutes bacterium]|nr:hypothetical protein [Bacillota bacterium]
MIKESRLIMLIAHLVSLLANGLFICGGIALLAPTASAYWLWMDVSIVTIALSVFGLFITFLPIGRMSRQWRYTFLVTSALNMLITVFYVIHMETTGGDLLTYLQTFAFAAASLLLLGGFFNT